jgi:transcription termination/antitermination protein NusG
MFELTQSRSPQTPSQSAAASANNFAWYALQTRPRHEKRVHAELQESSIHTFLPLLSERHFWSDRRQTVQVPLFPGYVFARMRNDLHQRVTVLRTRGVVSFVGVRGLGTSIPEEQVRAIQSILTAKVPFGPYPFLNVGQRVRIVGSSLDGVQGIVQARNGDASLVITVELIHRSIAIRISGYRVAPV